jgi:protein-serine/threonine kinase
LPPLSRLFPSRYTPVDDLPSREASLRTQSPIPSSFGFQQPHRRQFVELDPVDSIIHTSPERMSAPLADGSESAKTEERPKSKPPNVHILAAGASGLPTPVSIAQATPPPPGPAPSLRVGDIITEAPTSDVDSHSAGSHGGALKLELVRMLGQGAFSSVWAAKDVSGKIGNLEVVRKSSLRRSLSKSRKGSLRRKQGSLRKKVEGAVPKMQVDDGTLGEHERLGSEDSVNSWFKEREERLGRGRFDEGQSRNTDNGRLVALKMTDRSFCDSDGRTRVSFVREVEVLKVNVLIPPEAAQI